MLETLKHETTEVLANLKKICRQSIKRCLSKELSNFVGFSFYLDLSQFWSRFYPTQDISPIAAMNTTKLW